MQTSLTYGILSFFFLVADTLLTRFFLIQGIVPNFLLVWIVYLAIREGQITSMTAGFFLGIATDLLSGGDGMLGLAAASNTVAGFVAGYFYNREKIEQTLGTSKFIVTLAIASLVHNAIYFVIFLQGSEIGWWEMLFHTMLPTTLYTTVVGLVPMFVFARRFVV